MKPDLILIAEDNDDHVLLLRRALKKGAVVNPIFVVGDGEEAISYLAGKGKYADRYEYPLPGLLLLDLKMPGKDGFEVLQWIRQEPVLRRLRIVVLTTSDDPGDVNRAYDLGANSFIVKPIENHQFFGVTEAIKGYWLWMSSTPDLRPPELTVSTAAAADNPRLLANGEESAVGKNPIVIPQSR
jgi:CheY-like chemotaxis protein